MHAVGALAYCDGANLNAIMGIARPGDMGFDALHINLHKTFSTPARWRRSGLRSGVCHGALSRVSSGSDLDARR